MVVVASGGSHGRRSWTHLDAMSAAAGAVPLLRQRHRHTYAPSEPLICRSAMWAAADGSWLGQAAAGQLSPRGWCRSGEPGVVPH